MTCFKVLGLCAPGGHDNITISSYEHRNSYYNDKTVSRKPHTCKAAFILRWGPGHLWRECTGRRTGQCVPWRRHNMETLSTLLALCERNHDDVIKWKRFPRYWPFVREIHRSPVNSPHKSQKRGVLMNSLICAWINAWVNNREADDLGRHRAHYDVIVMPSVTDGFPH